MNKKLRILIVDDDKDILKFNSEGFESQGHHVTVASSGNVAIEILKEKAFDVIVSDLKMTNGDGLSLLSYVNTLNPLPAFFFASGEVGLIVDKCIEAGAIGFFQAF
ncbi:MAG: response regulator [Bacteriovoracaceae bacterium]|nr:response regulator [Bacteriovoracaceae bacterium]